MRGEFVKYNKQHINLKWSQSSEWMRWFAKAMQNIYVIYNRIQNKSKKNNKKNKFNNIRNNKKKMH